MSFVPEINYLVSCILYLVIQGAIYVRSKKSQYVQWCKKLQENHINIRFVPNIKTYNNNRNNVK